MSRQLSDLYAPFREKALQFVHDCRVKGVEVLIYCTFRTLEEQARLFRNGRSLFEIENKAVELDTVYQRPDLAEILIDVGPQHGKEILTWAGPGQSLHNYRYAFDGCPMRDGKPVWGTKSAEDLYLWSTYGFVAKELGLEWAGDWPESKREFPHVQQPGINWKELIGNG